MASNIRVRGVTSAVRQLIEIVRNWTTRVNQTVALEFQDFPMNLRDTFHLTSPVQAQQGNGIRRSGSEWEEMKERSHRSQSSVEKSKSEWGFTSEQLVPQFSILSSPPAVPPGAAPPLQQHWDNNKAANRIIFTRHPSDSSPTPGICCLLWVAGENGRFPGWVGSIPPEWNDVPCVVIGPSTLKVKDQLHKSGNLNIPVVGRGQNYVCHRLCQRKNRRDFHCNTRAITCF